MEQPNGKVPNGHAATPQSPTNGAVAAPQHFSYLGCGFARCAPGCSPSATERGDAWKPAWGYCQHLQQLRKCNARRCLLLDEQALLDARLNLRAAYAPGPGPVKFSFKTVAATSPLCLKRTC